MYAETGLLLPYYQNTLQASQQQLEEFCRHQKSNAVMNNLVEASMIFEYDLGGDWDLFKAPEPIIEGLRDMLFQKSISSGCLNSMEWMQGASSEPNFMNLPGIDLAAAYGIRRAFSEGDIKTLGSSNMSLVHPPLERSIITNISTIEERMEKLSRYRNKKAKRNFGRKIKYACRKALADNQPRIRGRFAKTEESTYWLFMNY